MAKNISKKKTSKMKATVDEDHVLKELVDIKRLMVLALMRDGASQGEIAAALGVSQSSVSRMFPHSLTVAKKSKA